MDSVAMIYTNFHKYLFGHSKVIGGGAIHRQNGDLINLLFFFKIVKIGYKINLRKCDKMLSSEAPSIESELRDTGNTTSFFTIPVIISIRKIYTG
jgi:hypothetical protein